MKYNDLLDMVLEYVSAPPKTCKMKLFGKMENLKIEYRTYDGEEITPDMVKYVRKIEEDSSKYGKIVSQEVRRYLKKNPQYSEDSAANKLTPQTVFIDHDGTVLITFECKWKNWNDGDNLYAVQLFPKVDSGEDFNFI